MEWEQSHCLEGTSLYKWGISTTNFRYFRRQLWSIRVEAQGVGLPICCKASPKKIEKSDPIRIVIHNPRIQFVLRFFSGGYHALSCGLRPGTCLVESLCGVELATGNVGCFSNSTCILAVVFGWLGNPNLKKTRQALPAESGLFEDEIL